MAATRRTPPNLTQRMWNGTWRGIAGAGRAAAHNWDNIGRLLGLGALIYLGYQGLSWAGRKAVKLGSSAYDHSTNFVNDVGETIDDKVFAGRNSKAMYTPVKIHEAWAGGDLNAELKKGTVEINFTGAEGGLYKIIDRDDEWNDDPNGYDVWYTTPAGDTFTPKMHLGESQAEVSRNARSIYRYATSRLSDKLKVDGPKF